MKKWIIMIGLRKEVCSLVSMDAQTNSCVLIDEEGVKYLIKFVQDVKYPFAQAKSGILTAARVIRAGMRRGIHDCKIVFE